MNGADRHDELVSLIPGYALAALDPEEQAELERHLETCDRCRAEVRELEAVAAAIGLAVTPAAPPDAVWAAIRRRAAWPASAPSADAAGDAAAVVERAPGEPPPAEPTPPTAPARRSRPVVPRRAVWALGAAAAVIVAALLAWNIALHRQAGNQAAQLRSYQAIAREVHALARTGTVSSAPVRAPSLPGVQGTVVTSASQGKGALLASNLGSPPTGRVYQLWVIEPGQAPRPGPVFLPSTGNALVTFSTLGARHPVIAVTIERGPATTPTLPIIMEAGPVA